jgi:lipoprotein-releasing system permease protein
LKTTEGADLAEIEKKLEAIWSEIVLQKKYLGQDVVIETWNEQGGIASLIAQLERDRTLMTILFAIMDVVCVFLILSIFYVIITEKIPDIGIIKSIGASGSGVGRVFFSYALAVGVFGALLGLAIGWPFVVNINQIHNWVAETFGWRVYDSSVLLFPDIPNQMDWAATLKIMIASVLACLVGSMIPAIRAVMMKPIKALRYE